MDLKVESGCFKIKKLRNQEWGPIIKVHRIQTIQVDAANSAHLRLAWQLSGAKLVNIP